ncbi:DUF4870 domain-containing protein [Actinomadura opuntiae]|uniref:DUF4870 domain-containing protein n=1 Tax=Actinomadura sp. OS1-43 TaxID=604315 RepID=UPI00255AFBFF|nr:DUF4870 domain-containing protein [Actinomadura sp. OS1-43]MDL4818914.1 DUF4870 domain-containing protein [Actinomadura sp. OS1-43]
MTDQPPPYGQPYGQPPGQPPGPPPGGPYDSQWGYGPPGVPHGPQYGPPRNDDNTWAIFAYVGTLVVSFIAPLVIYLVKMRESPFARFHAAQALNFQITMLVHLLAVAAVCVPPAIITKQPAFVVPLVFPYLELLIGQWVFLILGAVKAGKGEYYRFPTFFCFRMIR